MLAATAATADWEGVFKNPDLTANYEGHTTVSTVSIDPIAETFANNSDLFAGDKSGYVRNMDSAHTSRWKHSVATIPIWTVDASNHSRRVEGVVAYTATTPHRYQTGDF